jgi:hypothetical protein
MNAEDLFGKKVWWMDESHGMVSWVWGKLYVNYILMLKITSKVLMGMIVCLSLS